jgi:hypothetical protein
MKKLFASLMMFCLVLEVCARIDDRINYGADFFKPYVRANTIERQDSFGLSGKPGGHYQKWQLNNLGFRGDDIRTDKPQGIVRILCSGASETFGLYEDNGREWPIQLSLLLRKQYANLEVINASFYGTGFFYDTIIQRFINQWIQLQPDVFILYASFYCYLYTYDAKQPDESKEEIVLLFDHFRILGKIKNRCLQLIPPTLVNMLDRKKLRKELEVNRSLDPRKLLTIDEAKIKLAHDILSLNDFCKRNHSTLILSSYVQRLDELGLLYIWAGHPKLTREQIIDYYHEFNSFIKRLAEREHILFVDIADRVDSTKQNMADGVHFTNEGAYIMAQDFYPVVIKAIEYTLKSSRN